MCRSSIFMGRTGLRMNMAWKKLKRFVFKVGGAVGLAGVLALQGCAMVPGFGSASPIDADEALPADFQYLSADGAPEGVITSISSALIRTLAQRDQKQPLPSDVSALLGAPQPYTIGPGDVIGVIVYEHPELLPSAGAVISQQADPTGVNVAPGFIVSSGGEISFPYIGRIKLEGLTEISSSDLITKRLAEYIKDPQVTVRIQSFRSRRAYVEGEVKNPGLQIFTDVPMTLAEAISRSGGITTNGDRAFVTLTRNEVTTILNLPFMQTKGIDASRIPLKNGDVINVHNRDESRVYVMGEILHPSALLMRNGKLSLNEALGNAGGPNSATASTSQIYVIRNNAQGNPQIYHLNARNPAALALADRFPLRARDVVYVDSVPLVTWNRIVSLILPSAQVVYFGSEAAAVQK
jgi:polysaccharide export outer membrane protein